MIKEIVFATHNNHKVEEVEPMLSPIAVLSLSDINYHKNIDETGSTFHENAAIKANAVYAFDPKPVFADDSGLVIPSLGGEPGIYSSRYAGTGDSHDNMAKVLVNLKGAKDRSAYFISVICLKYRNETYYFEGKVHGTILNEIQGENGFGYDPIFKPNGYTHSFAQFSSKEKNAISHRYQAIKAMRKFLEQKI